MRCGNGGTGSVKCDFNVDLKKVLRFIETKKSDGGTVAVTHIALKALALGTTKKFWGVTINLRRCVLRSD